MSREAESMLNIDFFNTDLISHLLVFLFYEFLLSNILIFDFKYSRALSFLTLAVFTNIFFKLYLRASLVAQLVKNLPTMQKTLVQFLSQEDPTEKV